MFLVVVCVSSHFSKDGKNHSVTDPKGRTKMLRFRRQFSQLWHQTLNVDQQLLSQDLKQPLLAHLRERGLVSNVTSDDLTEALESPLGLYCGADPTARSLHIGNLLPLMVLLHCSIRGHSITGLVGGATGAVGDPSGRTTERSSIADEAREQNVSKIQTQMGAFFTNGARYVKNLSINTPISEGPVQTVNNFHWWEGVSFLGFLAQYGKHIRVGQMLARDSVKSRLDSESGIGFNEFAYQVLQAYDFWHLFKTHKVTVQVGGNDQWGNITAGIDLISRLRQTKLQAYGLTVPLLTTASGEKFGKSAGNAVFIDREITPSFDLYQHFIKTPDSEVEKLLKIFTFVPLKQIESIMAKHNEDPAYRNAQRVLANEVTDLIHGVGAGKSASVVSQILYPLPDIAYPEISPETLIHSFETADILKSLPNSIGQPFSKLVAELHGCSKKEAKKLVYQGAVYYGYDRLKVDPSDTMLLTVDQLIDGKLLLLRVGKSKYHVARV